MFPPTSKQWYGRRELGCANILLMITVMIITIMIIFYILCLYVSTRQQWWVRWTTRSGLHCLRTLLQGKRSRRSWQQNITGMLINILWQHFIDVDQYLLTTWCRFFSDCHTVINVLLSIFVCTHHLDSPWWWCRWVRTRSRGFSKRSKDNDHIKITIIMTSRQINK